MRFTDAGDAREEGRTAGTRVRGRVIGATIFSAPPKLNCILVAMDFSEGSQRALEHALRYANESEAEIILLHVLEEMPAELQMFEPALTKLAHAERAASELERCLSSLRSNCRARAVLRIGRRASREIVSVAAEVGAELIVMGRQRYSKVNRWLLGSTADQVLRSAPCGVLLAASDTTLFAS